MQDTSTQAMTEVALGLSMAFFSILILALLSMAPQHDQSKYSDLVLKSEKLNDADMLDVVGEKSKLIHTNADKIEASSEASPQFIFYVNEKFYDATQHQIKTDEFDHSQDVVIVFPKHTTLSSTVAIKQSIKHPNVSVTTMNDEWELAFNDY